MPDSPLHSNHLRADAANRTGKQASILVVDPQPLSLLALAGVLHSQGFQCVCARDLAAALRANEHGVQDLVIWEIGDDAAATLAALGQLRSQPAHAQLPAVLLADSRWAGLEKKTESLIPSTRCLFKPIDPHSLAAVARELLWMPVLESAHRRRGSQPSRLGWITL